MQATVDISITQKMIDFVKQIGIEVEYGDVPEEKEFVPGICINNGGLLINMEKLKYPGDILHEAGHLAVATPASRNQMDGILDSGTNDSAAEEMMAIAWSYAAALFIEIDPFIVFHEHGYKGGGSYIAEGFGRGEYFGVPMLEWTGLCANKELATERNMDTYPAMIKWIRE